MAKAAKGAAAARLVEDATAAPGVFVFGELLGFGYIQEVSRLIGGQEEKTLTGFLAS